MNKTKDLHLDKSDISEFVTFLRLALSVGFFKSCETVKGPTLYQMGWQSPIMKEGRGTSERKEEEEEEEE